MLYNRPKAAIIGALVYPQFVVGRGTRQGCPLSLSLFALAIEPIAFALRSSREVRALEVGGIRECTALYADDMLLFYKTQETVFVILCNFASFSGL